MLYCQAAAYMIAYTDRPVPAGLAVFPCRFQSRQCRQDRRPIRRQQRSRRSTPARPDRMLHERHWHHPKSRSPPPGDSAQWQKIEADELLVYEAYPPAIFTCPGKGKSFFTTGATTWRRGNGRRRRCAFGNPGRQRSHQSRRRPAELAMAALVPRPHPQTWIPQTSQKQSAPRNRQSRCWRALAARVNLRSISCRGLRGRLGSTNQRTQVRATLVRILRRCPSSPKCAKVTSTADRI